MSAKLVIKICVFFINFTNRQFWAARQFHWHEIRQRRKARAGKNSFPQPPSFLPARAFSLAREARRQFRSKKVRISSNKRTTEKRNFLVKI